MYHVVQSSATKKKPEVPNKELFKTNLFIEKFSHSMNILDLLTIILLDKMKQNEASERKISKVEVLERSTKNR